MIHGSSSLTSTGQASAPILWLSPLQGPVFLINSRLANVNFAPMLHRGGHLANLRPACLPSSLSLFLSLALVYSTSPPVSVCGTAYLKSRCELFLAGRKGLNHQHLCQFCIATRLISSAVFPADPTLWLTSRYHIETQTFQPSQSPAHRA